MQIFGVKTENNRERIVKSVFVPEYSSQILQNWTTNHEWERTVNNLLFGRDAMAVFPTGCATMFHLVALSSDKNRCLQEIVLLLISLLKSIIDDQSSQKFLLSFTAMELSFEVASPSSGLSRWNYEVEKCLLFCVHKHEMHGQVMCLIFLFFE